MKTAIFVVNTNEALGANAQESLMSARDRWQTPLVVCGNHTSTLHPACWKTMAFEIVEKASGPVERLLILDADLVVSAECPNPFELFGPEQLVVVSDRQTHNPARDKAETDEWQIVTGQRLIPPAYFNSGMMLASREHHGALFAQAAGLCERFPHLCWHDQTPFNVAVYQYQNDLRVFYADDRWNFHNPAERVRHWQSMNQNRKYVYHFPGNPDRQRQIQEVNWR